MVARPLPLFALMFLIAHAGCGRTELQRAEQGFRVEPAMLEFGKVLEGTPTTRTVTVRSTGRSSVPLTFEASAPFSVTPLTATVPGGGSLTLELTYQSSEGTAEGVLTVRGASDVQTVTLTGRSVRPLSCQPSRACREARFDLETERCLETVSADGSTCVPSDLCLDEGVCLEGSCLGTPRDCDDGNLCTQDGCSADTGCVNTPVVCPPPTRACHVAVCIPSSGCGEVTAPDDTLCGPVDPDCDFADLCRQGSCERITPAPDGLTCAAPTPCRPPGTCQAAACEQPPATPMVPAFSEPLPVPTRLDAEGRTMLVETSGGVAFELCGFPIPPGEETYFPDGVTVRPRCALASYTSAGFERFVRPYDDETPRALAASQAGTLLVTHGAALESYAVSSGALNWRADFSAIDRPSGAESATPVLSPGRVGVSSVDEAWVAMGYEENGSTSPHQTLLRLDADGGTVLAEDVSVLGEGGSLALAEDERSLWLSTPSGTYGRVALTSDGGVESVTQVGSDAGTGVLAVAQSSVLVGENVQVFAPLDGGTPAIAGSLGFDAGERPDGRGALLSKSEGVRFVRSCPAGSPNCAASEEGLYAERFPLASGDGWAQAGVVSTSVELAPPGSLPSLEAATLLQSGDLCAVTEKADGGFSSQLTAHRGNQSLFACSLAEGRQVRGARFGNGRLFVVFEQADGGHVLEGYRLDGLQLESKGWPVFEGAGGTKRPRP